MKNLLFKLFLSLVLIQTPYLVADDLASDLSDLIKKAEKGDVELQWLLGDMYYYGGDRLDADKIDYKEALKWYTLAAEQGNRISQFNVGIMYYTGEGTLKDYKEALKWFKLAAEQGDSNSQYNLGLMYYFGKGTPKNYKQAFKWYKLAAEQGDSSSLHYLGSMYYLGEGTHKDYKQAFLWSKLAAENGNSRSQLLLGEMYFLGKGIPKDYVYAYMWLNIAASNNNENAKTNLNILESKMTLDQIAKAQALSSECLKKSYKDC